MLILKYYILQYKNALEEKSDNVFFGKINEGNSLINEKGDYYDFLKIADGLRAGTIDLWRYKDIDKNQYMITNNANWICIGQIDYIPLMLKKDSNEVYIYNEFMEKDKQWQIISKFNEFITDYVFGEKYCMIVPNVNEDQWYQFIKNLKLWSKNCGDK